MRAFDYYSTSIFEYFMQAYSTFIILKIKFLLKTKRKKIWRSQVLNVKCPKGSCSKFKGELWLHSRFLG